jgi:hypothetical protein
MYKLPELTVWNSSYYYYFEVSHFIPAKHTLYTSAAQTAIYRADDNGMKAAFAAQQGTELGGPDTEMIGRGCGGGGLFSSFSAPPQILLLPSQEIQVAAHCSKKNCVFFLTVISWDVHYSMLQKI